MLSRVLLPPESIAIRSLNSKRCSALCGLSCCTHPFRRLRKQPVSKRRATLRVSCKTDYSPSASDDDILQKPPKEALELKDVTSVFGYPRNVSEKYEFGEIIGTSSYGTVKKCVEKETGNLTQCFSVSQVLCPLGSVFAVKIIPKSPKRGYPCTPRYLLKIRNEVEVMRQLGASLNAVYLKVVPRLNS